MFENVCFFEKLLLLGFKEFHGLHGGLHLKSLKKSHLKTLTPGREPVPEFRKNFNFRSKFDFCQIFLEKNLAKKSLNRRKKIKLEEKNESVQSRGQNKPDQRTTFVAILLLFFFCFIFGFSRRLCPTRVST